MANVIFFNMQKCNKLKFWHQVSWKADVIFVKIQRLLKNAIFVIQKRLEEHWKKVKKLNLILNKFKSLIFIFNLMKCDQQYFHPLVLSFIFYYGWKDLYLLIFNFDWDQFIINKWIYPYKEEGKSILNSGKEPCLLRLAL